MATFNPRKHLIQLKGKLYLETRYRIQWFRDDHPNGRIMTEVINLDPVIVKATVCDGEGNVMATAHAGAVDNGNAVWSGRNVEKSETAAIGRALAHAGYGTQFADDSARNSDASSERRSNGRSAGDDDLRDKDNATRFIQHWRSQSLSDAEVLAALGVKKLSEWTKGRAAADRAVNEWLATRLAQEAS